MKGGLHHLTTRTSKAVVSLYFVWSLYSGMFPVWREIWSLLRYIDPRSYTENEREPRGTEKLETHKVQFGSGDVIYKLWVIFDEVKLAPGLCCIICSNNISDFLMNTTSHCICRKYLSYISIYTDYQISIFHICFRIVGVTTRIRLNARDAGLFDSV
jgi:hypothetical protein